MLLTPRYAGLPIISLDGDPAGIAVPVIRQRRRLEALVAGLSEEQWTTPSRCAGWTVRDVITHLVDTNAFWTFSITSGLAGAPTRFLATFDPVASPASLVAAKQDLTSVEVLQRFTSSNAAFAAALEGLDADAWNALAEAPPGHLSVSAVAHHALWDGWVHERDIALPLGLPLAIEADEVLCALRYAAALSPAFALNADSSRQGALGVQTPEAQLVVTIADDVHVSSGSTTDATTVLRGEAVDLIEMLSTRIPLRVDVAAEDLWLFEGLATVFDATVDLAP